MKTIKIIAIFLGISFLWGCQKEEIQAELNYYENFFEIIDNPNDSVQHLAYKIYQEYGVPVFFNDTIGKRFVRMSVDGDSVFRYETIDLNWKFTSGDYETNTYEHRYIADPNERYRALGIVEKYLELIAPSIRPYSILVTSKTLKPAMFGGGTETMNYGIFFRTLLLSNLTRLNTEVKINNYVATVMQKVILDNFNAVPEVIEAFGKVSNPDHYMVPWSDLISDLPEDFDGGVLTDASAAEEEKAKVRAIIGNLGFVANHFDDDFFVGWVDCSPDSEDVDLLDYITEITSVSPREFVRRWGACPLVMQKYELIRDYIPVKE